MHTPLSILLKNKDATVHTTTPQTSSYDCATKMNTLKIGALLVLENDKLVGVITERDFLIKIVGKQRDPGKTLVSEIMTKNPLTVTPQTTVQEALKMITEKRFRHLPVIENTRLVGMISIGDLTKWIMIQQQNEIEALTGYIHGNSK